ncbi:ATP-grasp domain-containing protein [Streptomyces sp. NPDC001056]
MTDRPPVLHVGWMPRAVAALARAGADVTCAVAPRDAAAARGSDAVSRTVVVPDPVSAQHVLAGLARDGLPLEAFTAICSVLEYCIVPAQILDDLRRATPRNPGDPAGTGGQPRAPQMLAMRDKALQKTLVRRAGLPVADCTVTEHPETIRTPPAGPRTVLKPLDGGGARNTFLITGRQSLDAAVTALRADGAGPWLLEEYIPGTEFQVDGIVRDGHLRVLSVSRYVQNLIEVHDGAVVAHIVLPPARHTALYTATRALTSAALKALAYSDGPFHLEMFQDGERLVFGECAARVGGGRTDDVVRLAFGVDLREEWARTVLGRPSTLTEEPAHAPDAVFAGMNLPAPPGTVRRIPSHEQTLARPGVVHAGIEVAPGDLMPDITVASHLRAGLAVVRGTTETQTETRVKDLAHWFSTHTVCEPHPPAAPAPRAAR